MRNGPRIRAILTTVLLTVSIFVFAALPIPVQAGTTTIAFDIGSATVFPTGIYTESGMRVTSTGAGGCVFIQDSDGDFDEELQQEASASGSCARFPLKFELTSGSTFNVISVDLVSLGTFGVADFCSNLAASCIPSQTGFERLFGPQTFNFPSAGWTSITSFTWDTSANSALDNLVIDLVPESPVGGEILPIDMTSLMVTGALTNAYWILPMLGVLGALIVIARIRRRKER